MQLPMTIGLRRSRLIDGFVGLCGLLASLVILAFPRSALVQGGLLLLIWGLVLLSWSRCSPRLSAIRLEREGGLSIALVGEPEWATAALLPGATVHPWLTVLRLKTLEGRIFPLVLVGDSLDAADFRRLRVFLRWRAEFSVGDDDA